MKLRLFDRADGCKDHYCVGRHKYYSTNIPYAEFWNEKQQRFCSAGTVYIGKDAATETLKKLSNEQVL